MADQEKNAEPPKCAGGCGFFGNPACENFCSKCYRDRNGPDAFLAKTSPTPSSPLATSSHTAPSPLSPAAQSSSPQRHTSSAGAHECSPQHQHYQQQQQQAQSDDAAASASSSAATTPSKKRKKKNRCHVCNAKLGMMSFDCRCDGLFCSKHRLPDDHQCTFDFKTFDREKIAQANQTVKQDKINRI